MAHFLNVHSVSKKALMVLLLGVLSASLHAEGTVLEIEGATIRGNQELPTVLYVVPWQPAKVHSLDKSNQSLASSQGIKTLKRGSFLRVQAYHQKFKREQRSHPSVESKGN